MKKRQRTLFYAFFVWLGLSIAGAVGLSQVELERQSTAFAHKNIIAYRLLSQRLMQHDAILQMLALVQPPQERLAELDTLQAMFPQVIAIYRHEDGQAWPSASWNEAQALSAQSERAVMADVRLEQGEYVLLLAAQPASFAIQVSLKTLIMAQDWPFRPDDAFTEMILSWQQQQMVLSPGRLGPGLATFYGGRTMGSSSQPFQLQARRVFTYSELPWGQIALLSLMCALGVALLCHLLLQREEKLRAEELLHLEQTARLTSLREMGSSVFHGMSPPLNIALAGAQAGRQLLEQDPPEVESAREVLAKTTEQLERAGEALTKLRHSMRDPNLNLQCQPVQLGAELDEAVHLLMPDLEENGIALERRFPPQDICVSAEPDALGQIIHNLLNNAVIALAGSAQTDRRIWLEILPHEGRVLLSVRDNGPGIAPHLLERIFEPFFTTCQEGVGLGLGLSLSASLAQSMNGSLSAYNDPGGGAVFLLDLVRLREVNT